MKKIDDTARGMPLTPATVAITALDLMNRRKAPMTCCPSDGEPLISTLKYAGAEFFCQVCGGLFGFLSPVPKDVTPELQSRHDELRSHWEAGEAPG